MPLAKRPVVAVYFTDPGFDDPPFDEGGYDGAYREFAEHIAARGGQFAIARSMKTFLGGGRFSRGWIFTGGAFRETGPFVANLIFNKGEDFVRDDSSRVINALELDEVCRKDRTAELFAEHCPMTFVARNRAEYAAALQRISTATAVIKPPNIGGGEGVVIEDKASLLLLSPDFPVLVQETVDMSEGIPGHVEGPHDLRCLFIGDEIVIVSLRTPAPGKRVANVARGGSELIFPAVEASPPEPIVIARWIDTRLAHIPDRVYTIDFARASGGAWKVLEMNSPPGLNPTDGNPTVVRYHEKLADHLLRFAQ
jgi:glutathione synthase/RimK-type ligase-like ATP-grasp enzyme